MNWEENIDWGEPNKPTEHRVEIQSDSTRVAEPPIVSGQQVPTTIDSREMMPDGQVPPIDQIGFHPNPSNPIASANSSTEKQSIHTPGQRISISEALNQKDGTITQYLSTRGLNPLYVILGIYSIWHLAITAMAFASASGGPEWLGRTCQLSITPSDCGTNPWTEWWTDFRIIAEVIWCVPFILMIFFNSKMLSSSREICEEFRLTESELNDAKMSIPSVKVRKWVLGIYLAWFLTYGTLTHYDVVSFGVLGVIVLWPVYIIQGILIADTASIMPIFKRIFDNRNKFRLEPFEPSGTAGVEPFAENVGSLARIPSAFAFTMIIRSYIFLVIGGGESDPIRALGEMVVAIIMIGIALGISAGPLFLIGNNVLERREQMIGILASRNGLRDLEISELPEIDLTSSRTADMILIERIQDIQPVDSSTIMKILLKAAIPGILAVIRPLIGM